MLYICYTVEPPPAASRMLSLPDRVVIAPICREAVRRASASGLLAQEFRHFVDALGLARLPVDLLDERVHERRRI
jgi:hypothetical protein